MRFKKWPQLPGAGRTRAGHHHGSHTPTSPEAVLLGKMAYHTKQIRRQCTRRIFSSQRKVNGLNPHIRDLMSNLKLNLLLNNFVAAVYVPKGEYCCVVHCVRFGRCMLCLNLTLLGKDQVGFSWNILLTTLAGKKQVKQIWGHLSLGEIRICY